MKLKMFLTILISMFLLLLFSTVSDAAGTMEYSYKNGNFNIWGEGVKTTFSDYGYETHLKVDGSETRIYNGNGALNGVTCQIILSYVSNNNYVKVGYKLTNNSNVTRTVGVCSHADIMIGSNDHAPINNLNGNRGFTMTGDGHVFKFLGRDSYGVTNVDTYWFGYYGSRQANKWNTSYTYVGSSTDSGMAYSWQNRQLAPGQSIDLSILLGVGALNTPPTITANDFSKDQYFPGESVEVYGTVNDIDTGDTVEVRYAVDGGQEIIIASGIIPNGSAKSYDTSFVIPMDIVEGNHYVDVWAVDKFGDMSQSIRVYFYVVVDFIPPTGEHTLAPDDWTNQNVTITVVATDSQTGIKGITYPDGRFEEVSTVTYTVSQNDTYIFKLEDNAGNILDYPVIVNKIDRKKPNMTIAEPTRQWVGENIQIDYVATDDWSGIQRIILPNGEETISKIGSYEATENGIYKFVIYDKAGNVRTSKLTIGNIDKTKPILELSATTDWVADRVPIKWKVEDLESGISKIEFPDGTCNSSSSGEYVVTENGDYTFIVYDNVGNTQTQTISIQNIDRVKPSINLNYNQEWKYEEINVDWQIQDDQSGIKEIVLPNGSISQETRGTFVINKNGTYKFVVYDNVGNVETKEIVVENIDNKGPKIILSIQDGEWSPDLITIDWEVIDINSGLKEVILPNSERIVQTKGVFTVNENGKYTFLAYDNLGNQAKAEIEVNNIDKEKPEINLSLSTEEWTNADVDINWDISDDKSGVKEIIKPNGKSTSHRKDAHTVKENGDYTIIAYDNVGNQTSQKIEIKNIDKVSPILNITTIKLEDGQTQISWEMKDNESGIKEMILPNGEKTNEENGTFLSSENGILVFVAYDNVGNYKVQNISIP